MEWRFLLRKVFMALAVIACSVPAAFTQVNPSDRIQQLAAEVRQSSGVPAVAIVAVNSDGIIGTGAAGVRKAGDPAAVVVADAFHVGSVTKPMTATMIGRLVELGKLSWESTPAQVFPEWRGQIDPSFRDITLTQILAHLAGFAPYTEEKELAALPAFNGDARGQRREFAKYLLTRKPAAEPGTRYLYSNAGYAVAAAMAERVTGHSWEALMVQYIFRPLKLRSAKFGWPARRRAPAPWGHERGADGWVPQDPDGKYQLGPLLAPGGDVSMSPADLGEFLRSHLRGLRGRDGLLRAATTKRLHRQHSPAHAGALGWDLDGSMSLKTGSAGTFYTIAVVAPEKDLAFAVMLNAGDQKTAFAAAGKVLKMLGGR